MSSIFSNYQDIVSGTFTAEASGEYLLFYAAEFNVRSTSQSIRIKAVCDGVTLEETVSEAKDTTDYLDFFTTAVRDLEAEVHSLKIQACNSSTTKHNMRNARVVAIPLQANGLHCSYTTSEDYITNGSTTPFQKAALKVESGNPQDFYILACGVIGGHEKNGTSYNGYFDLTENETQIAYVQKGFKDNTDRLTFATVKRSGALSGEYTHALRLWSGASSNPPAGMENARIIALSRLPMEPAPGISASLAKQEDGWCGAVPVYAYLENLKSSEFPYARAKVITPSGQTFFVPMSWNTASNRFEGTIYPGSNLGNGCADPDLGTFKVRVELDDDPDFSSIDHFADTAGFKTFPTRRKSSKGTGYDYTDFNPVWDGDGWIYSINELVIYSESAKNNVAVALPFHPVTATISGLTVRFNGVSVLPGTASSKNDCWWWEESSHTLYLQRAYLDSAEVDVDITFKSDTDLFATRFDRVQTADMGNRLFYNGLMIANRYWTTFIFGGGNEYAGMQAESRAHEPGAPDVSVDCMERVAVHVDNVARNDGSGAYPYQIKWKQQEWMNYIVHEDNQSIKVTVHSDDTPGTGWAQQLDNGIAVTRTQTFYAGKRYIKQEYEMLNNGSTAHEYPLIWGREQWIGSDRDTNDRGRFSGDTFDSPIEARREMSSLDTPWMAAYDRGIYAAQALVFHPSLPPRYGYFLTSPALGFNNYEWVYYGDEYRPDDNDTGTNASNIFFDVVFHAVSPGQKVKFTFWQWFYDTDTWKNIESAIKEDVLEIQRSL